MPCTIIKPQYFKNFQCIADQCEDHCCYGWKVSVDQTTYHKMLAHPQLQSLTETSVIEVKHSVSDWAQMKLTPEKNCPFLTEEHLCHIHAHAGAEMLSDTCKTYPRLSATFNHHVYGSLSLSCPEAVRLVFFDADALALEIKQAEVSLEGQDVPNVAWFEAIYQGAFRVLEAAGDDDELALYAIGMLTNKAKQFEDNFEAQSVEAQSFEAFVTQLCEFITQGVMTENYQHGQKLAFEQASFVTRREEIYDFFTQLVNKYQNQGRGQERHQLLSKLSAEFMQAGHAYPLQVLDNAYREQVLPALASLGVTDLLSRYVAYQLFSNHYPALGKQSLTDQFCVLVMDVFFIRSSLSLLAQHKQTLTKADVVQCIQLYSSVRAHNDKFVDILLEAMQVMKLNEVTAVMSVLYR